MSPEPQREIEKDLLAYKQRRREQLGVAMELHPATRKMLQAEAARAASRPLLTSEEAAKNFVRSFVMSNQKQGFFVRHKRRVIWGGAMFACLAVVLAVLRNDPRLAEQRRAFPDALPTLPQVADAQSAQPQPTTAAVIKPQTEGESLARTRQVVPAADKTQAATKLSAARAGAPAPATPRGANVASATPTGVEREAVNRGYAANPARSVGAAPAPVSAPKVASGERLMTSATTKEADLMFLEKRDASVLAQSDRSIKSRLAPGGAFELEVKKPGQETKQKLEPSPSSELKRAQLVAAGGMAGGGGASTAPAPVAAYAPQRADNYAAAEAAQASKRFLQLDNQAGYRKNFNSPPLPQVMQDFAFERTGDRVRIVDADGSTYEGTVMAAPAEENRAKAVSQFGAVKQLKDALAPEAKSAGSQSAEPQSSYRFIANGVNRKLNQSVEFRGEWQPGAPMQTSQALLALQPVSLGVVRLEVQAMEKKEKAVMTNALTEQAAPPKANLFLQQQQNESSQGRISGRAVVGGKNEFEINAVPK